MRKLTKKSAILITGATKRLGLHFTRESLAMGFSVVAHYRTTKTPLITWLRKHPEYSGKVHCIQADLTRDPAALIDTCLSLPVKLIGMVNNASLFTEGDLYSMEHLQEIVMVNTVAPLLLARQFSLRIGTGWIIHILDANTAYNKKFQNYRISKKMLSELTLQQALLFAPNIRVNAIAPGAVLPPSGKNREYFDALKNKVPLRKNCDLDSVIQAFRFLVQNTCITGQILYVDSGRHLTG